MCSSGVIITPLVHNVYYVYTSGVMLSLLIIATIILLESDAIQL